MLLGIDLGTTFSASATLNPSGVATLTPDRRDGKTFHTPSVVHLGSRGALVGDPVEKLLESSPEMAVVRFAKAAMGTDERFFDDQVSGGLPAHAVSALVLSKLRRDFVERHTTPPDKVVVTVPAHFNERQRQATCDAARLADLPVVGLIEEPVAAATFIAASRKGNGDRNMLVFDLGGGTLDATLLHATADSLYVLGSEGAANVGGRNFDQIIMDMVRSQFRAIHGMDPPGALDGDQRLRQYATAAKLELSLPGQAVVRKPITLGGITTEIVLTRSQFENASRLWLEACVEVCERLLESRKLNWSDVDELSLTGGSSQLPCIMQALRTSSGLPDDRIVSVHPRSSIAYGAALLGEQLYGDKPSLAPLLRQTVSTNELGLRILDSATGKPAMEVLVPKNRPLPATGVKTFYVDTKLDDRVTIEVLQRKDSYCDPEVLGVFSFGPLPAGCDDRPLEISVGYDSFSRTHVHVTDQLSGRNLQEIIGNQGEGDLQELKVRLSAIPLLG